MGKFQCEKCIYYDTKYESCTHGDMPNVILKCPYYESIENKEGEHESNNC